MSGSAAAVCRPPQPTAPSPERQSAETVGTASCVRKLPTNGLPRRNRQRPRRSNAVRRAPARSTIFLAPHYAAAGLRTAGSFPARDSLRLPRVSQPRPHAVRCPVHWPATRGCNGWASVRPVPTRDQETGPPVARLSLGDSQMQHRSESSPARLLGPPPRWSPWLGASAPVPAPQGRPRYLRRGTAMMGLRRVPGVRGWSRAVCVPTSVVHGDRRV